MLDKLLGLAIGRSEIARHDEEYWEPSVVHHGPFWQLNFSASQSASEGDEDVRIGCCVD